MKRRISKTQGPVRGSTFVNTSAPMTLPVPTLTEKTHCQESRASLEQQALTNEAQPVTAHE